MVACYFFRRTGRSQNGPGGLSSARPLPPLAGGSAPGWLPLPPLLPGPVGRVRAGGPSLRAGPRAGLGLRAGLPADPAATPRAGLGVRCGGPPRDAPNQGGAEAGGGAGAAVGGGAAPPEDRAGLPFDRAGLPDGRAGVPDGRAGVPDDRAGLPEDRAGLAGGAASAGGRGARWGQRCRDDGGVVAAGGRAGGLLPALLAVLPDAPLAAAGGRAGVLPPVPPGPPLARVRPVPVSPVPDRDQPEAGRGPVPSRSGRSSGGAAAGLVSPPGVARPRPRVAALARAESPW
jgi:hypothetical protein